MIDVKRRSLRLFSLRSKIHLPLTNGDGSNRLKLETLCRTGARLKKAFPRGKGDREERAVDEGYIVIVPFVIH